jgi:hypothetical protein
MYKLIYAIRDIKHEVTAETLDEILSLSVDAYNQNAQLLEIFENETSIMTFSDIYEAIQRVYY